MHWRVKRMAVVVAAASVAMVLGTTGAFAQYIPPGTDCLETTAGSTWVQFGGFSQVPPIPEDFFFPGSEPFEGVVALRGDPLPGYVGAVNTLLERQEGADVSMGPAIVQVQLVELKLVSVDPIVVLDNAVPPGEHLYNVEVTLNPNAGFESMGYMNIVATSASGGEFSFDSAQGGGIDIYARFNFFEAWPSKVTTRLEPFDPPNPLFLESYSPIPWQYEMPLLYCEPDQNFYPVPGYEALLPLDEGATGEHGTTPPREVVGCCLPSGECINIEYQECLYYGGTPQADFCYGYEEACCFEDGRCRMLDPLCCMDLGGQVAWGKVCSTFTMACCFDDGSFCMDTDPACCELAGGWPGFAQQCLGDLNGNNIDDACETTDECRPTPDGSGCMDVVCPNVNDICLPRCVNYDPDTGAVIVLECECRDPDECHVDLFGHAARGTPCEVPDNGTGTVTLPPMGCEYLSPNEVHKIIEGLPPGTEIELAATHKGFFCEQDGHMSVCTVSIPAGECEIPGGSLGGHVDCFESTLHLEVTGTGALIGYNRTLAVPVGCEVHTGPRNPGEPVQTFENIMSRLQGELLGDLDFCVLKITGGNDFGLPSPGHTTLTQLPSGDFAVDSFFDITYQIEFEGCPGSPLDGMAGITTATITMETGDRQPPTCIGGCPLGEVCVETVVINADGTEYICCDCKPEQFEEACCLPDGQCIMVYPNDCIALGGTPQGAGTMCTMFEACCLQDGTCLDLDPLCCDDMGGTAQGAGTGCVDMRIACCFPDGSCLDVDPICCDDLGGVPGYVANCLGDLNTNGIDDACEEPQEREACCLPDGQCVDETPDNCIALGGTPQGAGTACTMLEGCCLQDGTCLDLDPLCCDDMGGTAQGAGTGCVDMTIACCLQDGSGACMDVDPLCCDDVGGIPGYADHCLGDNNGNGIDDACEILEACCLPDGTCIDTNYGDCVAQNGDPQGPGTNCATTICQQSKWAQPPTHNPDSPEPKCFYGWDDPSFYEMGPIVADDWPCQDNRPVTDVHWWGSYIGWEIPEPPPMGAAGFPAGFHIGIWTDVPAGVDQQWSHPGRMLWEFMVSREELNERPVGCDFHPEFMNVPDTCFKYDLFIPQDMWFYQDFDQSNIYWISISALYYEPIPIEFPWGWKTRRPEWNDDAVRIFDPLAPAIGAQFMFGEPIETSEGSWDMAFVLTTKDIAPREACCWSDGSCTDMDPEECSSNGGMPQGPGSVCAGWLEACCFEDGSCIDADPLCCSAMGGSPQGTGTMCSGEIGACCFINEYTSSCQDGMDAVCCEYLGGVPQGPGTLCTEEEACCIDETGVADNLCVMADPLCCDDMGGIPQGAGTMCTEDEACCLEDGTCVMADPLCCDELGGVAQGAGTMCTEPEGCCLQDGTCIMADPLCCDELGGTPQGAGTACVDMTIACCLDDGTCADVDPLCCDDIGGTPGYEPACLGDNNGNGIDDACEEPVIYEPKWSQRPHGPSEGFDAASGVWIHDDITGIKWQQRPNAELPGIHAHDVTDGIIILADDWLCEGGVVTDFHWWGTVEAPGMGIYGFQLSIHDNDPAGCVPGAAIWQVVIPITQIMVTPTGMFNSDGLEIFRYDYLLPEADWFYQEQGLTYWFNLSAISMDPSQPYIWRWQEAARTPLPRLCPAAGWTAPFPQMWLPIVWSDERYSDMAFVVTSVDLNPQEVNLVVADDFISDGRPIEAVRWWGSYFDDRYLPGVGVDPQRAVDGWIISFHHADPVLNPECPPDLIAGDQPPTALGLYFAPADAVEWMPLGYDDCFDHEVYEYKVDLARCCLLCSEIDPRSGFIPARRDAFHEECDFGYWLDIQAVVGAVWKTDQSGNECVLHYTNHIPSDLTVDGRFWGWHTSMDDKLNEACVGNVVDFNLNAQDCWDYGAWQKQLWECPWVPGPPVNMSFQLLTSWPTPLRIVGSWYTWKNHGAVAGELGIELDPAATGNDWHPSLGGGAGIETRRGSITKLTCTFSEPVNPVSFGVGDITICGCVNGNFNPSSISLDFTNTVLTMNFAPLTLGNGEMGSLADRYMVVISTNVTSAATGAHLSCDRDVEVIAQFGNVLNFGPSAGLTNSTDLNQISTRIGQAVPVPAPVKYDVFYIGPSAGIVNTTDYNQTSSNLTTTGPICVIPPTCP